MIGQEHHRHFAIKRFAQFMTRSQVFKAFMEEFRDELPKPLTQQQTNRTLMTQKTRN